MAASGVVLLCALTSGWNHGTVAYSLRPAVFSRQDWARTGTAAATGDQCAGERLRMVEHAMPLMESTGYEAAVQRWARETAGGEVVRWYISRVDEAAAEAIAEVVLLSQSPGAEEQEAQQERTPVVRE